MFWLQVTANFWWFFFSLVFHPKKNYEFLWVFWTICTLSAARQLFKFTDIFFRINSFNEYWTIECVLLIVYRVLIMTCLIWWWFQTRLLSFEESKKKIAHCQEDKEKIEKEEAERTDCVHNKWGKYQDIKT